MLYFVRYCAVIAAIAAVSGCASRSVVYRLVPTDDGPVLVPPGVKNASVTARRVKLNDLSPGECPAAAQGVALRRQEKRLTLHVTQSALYMRPNGWLLGWAGDLEGSGCLPPGQGLTAAHLVAQALPSDVGREYALLNSATRTTGRVDLEPWSKLRVTTPIYREGAPARAKVTTDDPGVVEEAARGISITLTSSDFVGYEVAWYSLRPRPDGGARLDFDSSETHIGDQTTRLETSRQQLEFGPEPRYFRMLVLTRVSASDHDTAFLAGSTLAELEERTQAVEADPARCEGMVGCVAIDTRVALLPFVTIQANGEEILAPPGSTVGQALREAGETDLETITATLRVERDYAGQLTPVAAEAGRSGLLELNLLGGESISWQTKHGH
ncbi:MAG: hypothetical protein O3A53_08490 [Acidobacteria bacterium]|nr:hypothetical protein [Acidobacteriota bacterium]MDA1234825.1 hypothetical protein [Acidobacteriota bacterium]